MTIPEGPEIISRNDVHDTTVEKITIPASAKEIQEDTFAGLKTLKEVTFKPGSKLEKIGAGAFD